MKRKQKKSLLWLLLLALLLVGILLLVAKTIQENPVAGAKTPLPEKDTTVFHFGQLLPVSEGELIQHHYYTLAYSEEHEQALWVFYELKPEMVDGPARRSDAFRTDPAVSTGSATLADYKGSGYDRGHLCPAASMSISQEAMDESFFLSNMSPQTPSFNRGGWKKLEEQVREWARQYGQLFVATGPVLREGLPCIGGNQVSVPEYYYKVVYAPRQDKMISFVLPNASLSRPVSAFAVSVDSVESLTGIDFFSALPDSTEDRLESQAPSPSWNW